MFFDVNTYLNFKYSDVQGRYVTNEDIMRFLEKFPDSFKKNVIGYSVLKKPIFLLTLGNGSLKVFAWSQMHGNEGTTTKATLDLILWLMRESKDTKAILAEITLYIIPILNPDGAEAYTRFNANEVDLNRDAVHLTQPESKILRAVFEQIDPDFCFNLHDQRTIFSVGNTPCPATVSFLAPAEDSERTLTSTRKKAIQIIDKMIATLQLYIPGQVGRFDDSFNINCVGDMFTSLGKPTILFEAGHYQDDYEREETRKYIFLALISALQEISENEITGDAVEAYFTLPENEKRFFDILIKNFPFVEEDVVNENEIGVLFKENLENNSIFLFPYVEKIGNLQYAFGHKTVDASKTELKLTKEELLKSDIQSILRKL